MIIKLKNWEKYNPKRDQKHYTWLRLSNDIVTDHQLFGLSAAQKFAWVAILCEASKQNTDTISLNFGWLYHFTGVATKEIQELINHLAGVGIIAIHDTRDDNARSCVVTDTTPTYERTNVRTNETNERAQADVSVSPGLRPMSEDQKQCEQDWIATLKHFKIERSELTYQERVQISEAIKKHGLKECRYALVGYRFEAKTESYDPAKNVNIRRVFDPDLIDKWINLASQQKAKEAKSA